MAGGRRHRRRDRAAGVILFGPLGRPDSDEVIAGLIARHIGSDGLPAFFWGQHYGGTIEALPVALSLKVFGTSVAALRVPTLAARGRQRRAGVAVRSAGDERGQRPGGRAARLGVAAGGRLVRLREMLFYAPTVTLGLTAVLLALRLGRPDRVGAPCGRCVARRVGRARRRARPRVVDQPEHVLLRGARRGGACCSRRVGPGASPCRRGGASSWASARRSSPPCRGCGSTCSRPGCSRCKTGGVVPPDRAATPTGCCWFFTHGLPAEMGFREIGTFDWVLGAARRRRVPRRRRSPWPWSWCGCCAGAAGRWAPPFDVVGFLLFPLIMATIPFVKSQGNLRYLFFLAPFLCLLLARARRVPTGRGGPCWRPPSS